MVFRTSDLPKIKNNNSEYVEENTNFMFNIEILYYILSKFKMQNLYTTLNLQIYFPQIIY